MCKATPAILSLVVVLFVGNVTQAGLIGNYNINTGELELVYDGAEGELAGIRLSSPAADLVAGQATDLGGRITGPLSVINDQAPNFIEWGNLVGLTFGSVEAGAVLPSGLFQSDLNAGYELLFRSLANPTVDVQGTLVAETVCLCPPIPSPGSRIDLTDAYRNNDGRAPAAISFVGVGTISSATVIEQSLANLFGASIDGLSIDLSVDTAIGRTVPAGTQATGLLLIETSTGDFNYELTATVPEPETLVLLVPAAVMMLFNSHRRGDRSDV